MKEAQQDHNANKELGISRRFQLFKYIVGVIMVGVVLGGVWLQRQASNDAERGREKGVLRTKLNEEAQLRFVNNPTIFDNYKFSVNKVLPTGEVTTNIELLAKIIEVGSEGLSLDFKLLVDLHDTVDVQKEDLIKVTQDDTLELRINEELFLVNSINGYSRSDGPRLRVFSFGKHHVNISKTREDLIITSIESFVGEAKMEESFPYKIIGDRFSVQIEREEEEVDFLLKGKTKESENWTRRIIIKEWDSFLFIE